MTKINKHIIISKRKRIKKQCSPTVRYNLSKIFTVLNTVRFSRICSEFCGNTTGFCR